VWGLSFKPQTDDMREAPSIDIINGLRDQGAKFKAYDPVAVEVSKSILGNDKIEYFSHYYDTLKDTDALLLLTEWHQFREPDFNRMKSLMKSPVIFDGRNQYDMEKIKEKGFIYYCVGRK
jgi:UDPglucose 6-dehydrogenase